MDYCTAYFLIVTGRIISGPKAGTVLEKVRQDMAHLTTLEKVRAKCAEYRKLVSSDTSIEVYGKRYNNHSGQFDTWLIENA